MSVGFVIDCDPEPTHIPKRELIKHVPGGKFRFDQSKLGLFVAEQQKVEAVRYDHLSVELERQQVANYCLLEFLRRYPVHIPEAWKAYKRVVFWGTIQKTWKDGDTYAFALRWYGEEAEEDPFAERNTWQIDFAYAYPGSIYDALSPAVILLE